MTYEITKEIRILHIKDGWDFVFKTDTDGTVRVQSNEGLEALSGESTSIYIYKDCIQHFIDALEQLKNEKSKSRMSQRGL
ncbi:hypothetical protein CCP3SC1AL1_4650002 [Gammaproteobacteria bacterium]